MKNKKYLLLIPVVALGLTACQDPTTTTTTSDPGSTTTTSEPDPTTTTTEPPAPVVSVASVLANYKNLMSLSAVFMIILSPLLLMVKNIHRFILLLIVLFLMKDITMWKQILQLRL